MVKHSSVAMALFRKRWLTVVALLVMVSVTTAIAFITRASLESSCDCRLYMTNQKRYNSSLESAKPIGVAVTQSPLSFMKSRLVLLVSDELSLSGGPLLFMELAFLLRGVGAEVCWITNQKPTETNNVVYSLEHKMNMFLVLPKVLWWIHEMRGHYFSLDYVKHLPYVAGAMIDSHVTAEYWKNRTQERLRKIVPDELPSYKMPKTHVVHLGNNNELMEIAEDSVAKRILREHVRESLGVRNKDILFALLSRVTRGNGQDLFLRSFYESLHIIQERKLQLPSVHAAVLRNFVISKKIQNYVHFVNKTLTVAPYLVAVDVLVQIHQVERWLTMGKKGYEKVKETFLERHMEERIAAVLMDVLPKAKGHQRT
ncbi:unnamed protein product [Withania somnifera]